MRAFLSGRLCTLRPVTEEDLPSIIEWSHDREVTEHLCRGTFPAYAPKVLKDFRAMAEGGHDIELIVVAPDPERAIGVTGLHDINWVARSAEFRILIGDKAMWGRGIGTEVVQLMTAYGFELLNLHKVSLGVNNDNERARRSYLRVGFVVEGELRDEVFRNGVYHHATRMSMLEEEYRRAREQWPVNEELKRQFPRRS